MREFRRVRRPRVGDFADHRSRNLDPRVVSRVSEDGKQVWLELRTREIGPVPAANYTFERAVS